MTEIIIRTLHTLEEMEEAVKLQSIYWGEDMGALVPGHMLLSIAKYGGHVHGAFDGNLMVGMLLGFLGADIEADGNDSAPKRLLVMSKRMVVLPDYRSQQIGERLKLAQRDFALRHDIQLVTWTFDPLLSRNAYLNLHKLAGTGQKYEVNYFGSSAAPTLSGDRLVVNWWVNHPETKQKLTAEKRIPTAGMPVNRVSVNEKGQLVPADLQPREADTLMLEIPPDFVSLAEDNPQLGQRWRDHVREGFQTLLNAGYIATDYTRFRSTSAEQSPFSDEREHTCYIFTRDDGTYSFQ